MKTIPLDDTRSHRSMWVDEVVCTHEVVRVSRDGRPAAVTLADDDCESMIETLDVLSDPELAAELVEARRDISERRAFTLEAVTAEMRARGRL